MQLTWCLSLKDQNWGAVSWQVSFGAKAMPLFYSVSAYQQMSPHVKRIQLHCCSQSRIDTTGCSIAQKVHISCDILQKLTAITWQYRWCEWDNGYYRILSLLVNSCQNESFFQYNKANFNFLPRYRVTECSMHSIVHINLRGTVRKSSNWEL